MAQEHYFRRSFAMLRRDKGWAKPLLALAAASLVPIAGQLGVQGYAMEWARLTAWGVDAAPKQKGVKVGACIAAGWRAFVATIVPPLVFGLLARLLSAVVDATGVGALQFAVGIIVPICNFIVAIIAMVCALHATVYQDFRAGFSYRRIVQMIEEDFGGIAKIAALNVTLNVLVGLAVGLVASVTLGMAIGDVASHYLMWTYDDVLESITWAQLFGFLSDVFAQLEAYALPMALLVMLGGLGTVFTRLVVVNAVGLWMRQFDVPHWGARNEPLRRQQPLQLPAPGAYPGAPTRW